MALGGMVRHGMGSNSLTSDLYRARRKRCGRARLPHKRRSVARPRRGSKGLALARRGLSTIPRCVAYHGQKGGYVAELSAGMRLGPSLVLERLIGRGGMGEVWLATDEVLGRRVAVKWWSAAGDPERMALQLLLEARAAARVVHPAVVAVHSIGDHRGQPYIEMEFVDGPSMRAWWRDEAPTLTERLALLAQVAQALDAAHEQGVVHCDVKPENVLTRRESQGPWLAKLADFGLARSRADGAPNTPLSHGTLAYLAPELAHHQPTAASDGFALAAMTWEALCGSPPERPSWKVAPILGSHTAVPGLAMPVLQRGLAADPADRFPTAVAFIDALFCSLDLPTWSFMTRGLAALAPAATSVEVALPVPNWPADNAVDILGALLAALANFPALLTKAYGAVPRAELVLAVVDRGLGNLDGDLLTWAAQADREACLLRLPGRLQRLVLGRAAAAIEATVPRGNANREEATQLYIAARRLGDAARLALESAETTANARRRRHHLARAVAFSTSPTRPRAWLETLLLLVEWDVRCGATEWARGPLAEAQGVLVEARLAPEDPLRLRVALADAALRLAQGAPQAALARLQAMAAPSGQQPELLWHRKALLQMCANQGCGEPAEPRPPPGGQTGADRSAAAGLWQLALAGRAHKEGDAAAAERHAARALAMAEERGDALEAGQALVRMAELAMARQKHQTAWHTASDALAVLRPVGTVQATAQAWLQRGRAALAQGRGWQAHHALAHAQAAADELGLPREQSAALPLLIQSALEAGEVEQARQWQQLTARQGGTAPLGPAPNLETSQGTGDK